MKKLFLYCLLVLCLANTAFSATVSVNYDRLTYTVDTTKKTAECAGPQNTAFEYVDLVIPDYIPYNGENYPVVSIADEAFFIDYYNRLNMSGSLTIGNNVKTIGNSAFDCCNFNGTLTLGQSVETIGTDAFSSNRYTGSLVIPNSVKTIGEGAFSYCLTFTGTIIIGDGVENIYAGAFESCTGITSVYIGKSVKNIGTLPSGSFRSDPGDVFRNCTNLQSVICAPNIPPTMSHQQYGWNFGFSSNSTFTQAKLYLTNGSLNSYKTADEWKNFKSITTIDANATSLSIDKTSLSLNLNESDVICATATPYYTWDEVSWSVNPTGIVSIENDHNELSEAGALAYLKVTGKQGGKATITATCGNYTATCEVEVNVPVSGISLNKPSLSMTVGDNETLIATLQPTGATGDVEWSVSPDGIVSVDNGVVTALASGQAVVTAKCGDYSAACNVTVTDNEVDDPTTPGVSPSDITATVLMVPDEDRDFSALLPAGVSVSSWESTDEDIAEVNKRGRVDAWEFGRCYIMAKDADGKNLAVYELFVCPTVTVEHGSGAIYSHHVVYNSAPTLSLKAGDGYRIAGATHGKKDIYDEIMANDGKYVPAEPITSNSVLNLALEKTDNGPTTGADAVLNDPNIRILVNGHTINIVGVPANTVVRMYNLGGTMLFDHVNYPNIEVIDGGVYLIEIDGQPNRYKVLVR